MQAITTIGLDTAKSVFQVHGVDAGGNVVLRRQLKRRYILAFFQNRRAWSVSKACASSYHQSGARTLRAPATAISSRLAYRRRPTQQLRQIGKVHRQPPRLVLGQRRENGPNAPVSAVRSTSRIADRPW